MMEMVRTLGLVRLKRLGTLLPLLRHQEGLVLEEVERQGRVPHKGQMMKAC